MMRGKKVVLTAYLLSLAAFPSLALAHRSGCHTLHTCPSDTNNYTCGDLGYPCDGSVSIKTISPAAVNVPLLVEQTFRELFDRKPSEAESQYWKKRFRAEKNSIYKLRPAMAWHKAQGSFGPPAAVTARENLLKNLDALFSSVYDGRLPTPSEHAYWQSRLKDKPTEAALRGAMTFHKEHNVQH